MALRCKFLSPTCAPDLVDVDAHFFFGKYLPPAWKQIRANPGGYAPFYYWNPNTNEARWDPPPAPQPPPPPPPPPMPPPPPPPPPQPHGGAAAAAATADVPILIPTRQHRRFFSEAASAVRAEALQKRAPPTRTAQCKCKSPPTLVFCVRVTRVRIINLAMTSNFACVIKATPPRLGGGSPSLVTRHVRVLRGRAPTCGWAATARLVIARAAFRMHLYAAAPHAGAGTSAGGGAGSRAVSTRTCRTRRVGAGATGSVRRFAGVPQAAAAAAAAPGSAARATGFWVLVLAYSCAGAGALSSRCARAALALRSRCATHTPASGEPESWAVHDDGGSSPSSSLPSCCHCAVIIHAKLGLPHYRPSPPL